MNQKKIKSIHKEGSSHWVGDGFPVRNFFPSNNIDISPFLMLDYAGPAKFAPTKNPRGVGEHPHRGFETVTISYKGSVEHRDSAGNAGTIHPGDVQWMTAGSGVVHEEMHEKEFASRGGEFEMIQLWVNLPKQHKMTQPRYQTLLDKDIKTVKFDSEDSYARIIAGSLLGVSGPANTFTPVNLFDLHLSAGSKVSLPVCEGHNSAALLMHGKVKIDDVDLSETQLVLFDLEGKNISVETIEDSIILFMSGEPIKEPVVSYGPFVMNTKAEIVEAFDDFQSGKMGRLK